MSLWGLPRGAAAGRAISTARASDSASGKGRQKRRMLAQMAKGYH